MTVCALWPRICAVPFLNAASNGITRSKRPRVERPHHKTVPARWSDRRAPSPRPPRAWIFTLLLYTCWPSSPPGGWFPSYPSNRVVAKFSAPGNGTMFSFPYNLHPNYILRHVLRPSSIRAPASRQERRSIPSGAQLTIAIPSPPPPGVCPAPVRSPAWTKMGGAREPSPSRGSSARSFHALPPLRRRLDPSTFQRHIEGDRRRAALAPHALPFITYPAVRRSARPPKKKKEIKMNRPNPFGDPLLAADFPVGGPTSGKKSPHRQHHRPSPVRHNPRGSLLASGALLTIQHPLGSRPQNPRTQRHREPPLVAPQCYLMMMAAQESDSSPSADGPLTS